MLFDMNNTLQPAIGTGKHWKMLIDILKDAVIFDALRAEVTRIVAYALTSNQTSPQIGSRVSGADALNSIASSWHAQFPRRFDKFPNGAARGVFGMALWHYLALREDRWCFSEIGDPYGFGQTSKYYWRL